MNKLFQTLMRNIKISYINEQSIIKFDEYFILMEFHPQKMLYLKMYD